jgi:predicted P-loop ATPase
MSHDVSRIVSYSENLSALFSDKLASSGLDLADAARLDYTVCDATDVSRLGLWRKFPKVSALRLPYHDPWGGEWEFARYRALRIPAVDKFPKYVQPHASSVRAYFPRLVDWQPLLKEPTKPLIITEGELKAAKATKEGFPTIGLGGVWNFKTRMDDFLPELNRVTWHGRQVYIIFDSDVDQKIDVQRARMALGSRLMHRGAIVRAVPLPELGGKTGLDDYLIKRTTAELQALIDDADLLPVDWKMMYHWAKDGPIHSVENVLVALSHAPELKDVFAYDLMSQYIALRARIPNETPRRDRRFIDSDVTTVQVWLQREGLLPRISSDAVYHAIRERARQCSFHSVVTWLEALPPWDGHQRAEAWLTEIFHADLTPYVREVSRMFIVAMVARILAPGCKMDYMLILEGIQGVHKSTALELLAGSEYFADDLPHIGHDDVRLSTHLRRKWLIELGELGQLKRAEVEDIKRFITRRVENYIPKYGREEVREPRQCVFVGTTNQETYLKDDTGNRRFWPVRVPDYVDTNIVWLRLNREQLFAEALHRYYAGEQWFPDHDTERRLFVPEQEARRVADELEEAIVEFLEVVLKDPKPSVTTNQLATHLWGDLAGRRPTGASQRIAHILRRLGWAAVVSNGKRIFYPDRGARRTVNGTPLPTYGARKKTRRK